MQVIRQVIDYLFNYSNILLYQLLLYKHHCAFQTNQTRWHNVQAYELKSTSLYRTQARQLYTLPRVNLFYVHCRPHWHMDGWRIWTNCFWLFLVPHYVDSHFTQMPLDGLQWAVCPLVWAEKWMFPIMTSRHCCPLSKMHIWWVAAGISLLSASTCCGV